MQSYVSIISIAFHPGYDDFVHGCFKQFVVGGFCSGRTMFFFVFLVVFCRTFSSFSLFLTFSQRTVICPRYSSFFLLMMFITPKSFFILSITDWSLQSHPVGHSVHMENSQKYHSLYPYRAGTNACRQKRIFLVPMSFINPKCVCDTISSQIL